MFSSVQVQELCKECDSVPEDPVPKALQEEPKLFFEMFERRRRGLFPVAAKPPDSAGKTPDSATKPTGVPAKGISEASVKARVGQQIVPLQPPVTTHGT